MKNKKRLSSYVLCLILCLSLLLGVTGCVKKSAALLSYGPPEKFDQLKTTCVAENDRYSLIWNAESSRVILYDKIKDHEWSYVPYESLNSTYDAEGYEANNHPQVESPIIIDYYTTSNLVSNETNAFAQSINKDDFTLRAIENGVEMVLYFEKFRFTVPVSFVLVDDGIEVSVDVDRIEEDEEYCISNITIAPFFCAISNKNSDTDNHYLFMPSGTGTLIYPRHTDGLGNTIFEPLYGGDANIVKDEILSPTESVKLPVYGAVNNDRAVCAIIKEGAEFADLKVMLDQNLTGYSYITSKYRVRGYQEAIQTLFTSSVVKTNLYADAFTPCDIKVGFYPMYDEDASYNGFAKKYKEHMNKDAAAEAKKSDDKLLNVKFFGGIKTKKFIFGVPSDDMLVATTINQVYDMVEELDTIAADGGLNVNLVGFGSSGNDIGVVAGDCEIGGAFGDEDDLKKLSQLCNNVGADLFFNFDVIRFNSSGNGVSTMFGKADSANGSYTEKGYYDVVFRTESPTLSKYYLANRDSLAATAQSVKNTAAEWGLGGVSLDTLTSMVYSDYSNKEYYSGANYEKQISAIMKVYNEAGIKIAGSDANGFAAEYCAHIYDVPTQSTNDRYYTVDVPFYQMVFKGKVSMSGSALNFATNKTESVLKAVESGMGFTYNLIGKYNTNLISSAQNVFYGAVYWDDIIERGVKTEIEEIVAAHKDYFEAVKNASIVKHEIINDDVRKTTYDNGVTIYVNYGANDYSAEDVAVSALGYTVVKGA